MTSHLEEVDPLISDFLYNYIRYTIDRNDFELFRETIYHISLLNIENPRFIQNDIYSNLFTEIQAPLFIYDQNSFNKILKEISCFEFLLKYWSVRDFSSMSVLITAYNMYKKSLEKYISSISESDEIIVELAKMYGLNRSELLERVKITIESLKNNNRPSYLNINKKLQLLFASLKLHFTYYRIGAFIIFEGKEKQIDTVQYLKELWDHTQPEDADGINLNETPILFDPLWLTYLHVYGGKNVQYWTKTVFGISLGFDYYHGAEKYLYQYYLLTITRCIQKGNKTLNLPTIEELDNLKVKEPYKFKELYDFVEVFKKESEFLIPHCDELIGNAHKWDLLFKNDGEAALIETKQWLEDTLKDCEKIADEFRRRMIADNEKIDYYSQKVREEYQKMSILGHLSEIRRYNQETDRELQFIKIYRYIGNLDKRWFFKDDDSYPDHIFSEFGREIARGEEVHILDTIKKMASIEIIKLKENFTAAIFDKIKAVYNQMKTAGFNPTVVFLPLEVSKNFVIEQYGTFSDLKIDENVSLKIINANNRLIFDDIIILDKSAGVWTYKPINGEEERLFVEITPNEKDELKMKILVKTTINYRIIHPESIKILKFDLSVIPSM